jgi:transcriptional regulator with XRE-family HTH domain
MVKSRPKVPSKEKAQVVFGAALRTFREDKGLTQQTLAELAELHTNYVSSVERGERNLSLHNIAKLAYALEMDVSALVLCLDRTRQ